MTTKIRSLVLVTALLPCAAGAAPVGPLSTYLVEPCRFLDTREEVQSFDAGPFPLGQGRAYRMQESCDVPIGAAGVIINVTVTGATGAGHLSVWPGDYQVRPGTSGINFAAGSTLANGMTVRLAANAAPRYADIWVTTRGAGEVHVIIDVVGYLR